MMNILYSLFKNNVTFEPRKYLQGYTFIKALVFATRTEGKLKLSIQQFTAGTYTIEVIKAYKTNKRD